MRQRIYDMDDVPTVDEYVRGLTDLRPQMREQHFRIFQAQYAHPEHTANTDQIARAAAIQGGHSVVNRLYGGLGHSFCDTIGFKPMLRPNSTYRWWSTWSIGHSTKNRGFLWQMRPQVVDALERLGWVQPSQVPEVVLTSDFDDRISKARSDSPHIRRKRLATAPRKPAPVQVIRTEFRRNADVVAEVLARANGVCENCGSIAPFIRASDGTPYLEIHHIIPLADSGDDTVDNAVALCPNCHRERHFGVRH